MFILSFLKPLLISVFPFFFLRLALIKCKIVNNKFSMQDFKSFILSPAHQPSLKLQKLKRSRYLNPVKIEEIKSILEQSLNHPKGPNFELPSAKHKSFLTPSPRLASKVNQTKSNFHQIRIRIKKKPLPSFQSLKSTSLYPVLQISKSHMQPRSSFINRSSEIHIPNVKFKHNQQVKPESFSSSSSDIENFRTMYH